MPRFTERRANQIHRVRVFQIDELQWRALIGVIVLTICSACVAPPSADTTGTAGTAPEVGSYAPDFSLTALDGRPVALSDLRGQVVLLNFWTTDCVPCRAEMPDIQAAYQDYQDRNFVVLSINVKEGERAVAQFAQEFHLTMPVLLDRDGSTTRRYRVRGLPTSFLVDPEGVIRKLKVGEINYAYIESYLAVQGVLALSDLPSPTPTAPTPTRANSDQATAMPSPTPAAPTPTRASADQATAMPSPTPTPASGPQRLDLDEIFPPDEGRELVFQTCLSCHEILPFGGVRKSRGEWLDHQAEHTPRFAQLSHEARPSDAELETLYEYLITNFDRGRPNSKQLPPGWVCVL